MDRWPGSRGRAWTPRSAGATSLGVALLAGIGFTVSLLVSDLAFAGPERDAAKTAVLAGSLGSALLGVVVLGHRDRLPDHRRDTRDRMRAAQLAEQVPMVRRATTGAEAARVIAEYRLSGLVVAGDDGVPIAVIPGSQILSLVLPQYVRDEPNLAHAYDELGADELCGALNRATIGELLEAKRLTATKPPSVLPEDTLIEIASAMDAGHTPVILVIDRDGRLPRSDHPEPGAGRHRDRRRTGQRARPAAARARRPAPGRRGLSRCAVPCTVTDQVCREVWSAVLVADAGRRPMSLTAVLALLVFATAYVVIVTERFNRTAVALLGAAAMVAIGAVRGHEIFFSEETGIDWNVIFLLFGMMVIVGILRQTGVFEFLAIWSAQRARARPFRMMVLLVLITAVASALLDNVTTVLLVAPVTLLLCERLALDPVPFLLAEVMASNIGGTATLIGDPPNIIIGSRAGLGLQRLPRPPGADRPGAAGGVRRAVLAPVGTPPRASTPSGPRR